MQNLKDRMQVEEGLEMKCSCCNKEIFSVFDSCPFCGAKQKDGKLEGEVYRALVIDGRGYKFASFVSYLALPVGIIVSIICACLNVWLIKRHDILGVVNTIDYLAIAVLGYIATKGLKNFKKYGFNSLMAICLLTTLSNIFRFVSSMDMENPYDIRCWKLFSIVKIVLSVLTAVYFMKRRKAYNK